MLLLENPEALRSDRGARAPPFHQCVPSRAQPAPKTWIPVGRGLPAAGSAAAALRRASRSGDPQGSVVGPQPEELQQLLVVRLDEVSRLLAAVVLQLGVGTERQEVAETEDLESFQSSRSGLNHFSLLINLNTF